VVTGEDGVREELLAVDEAEHPAKDSPATTTRATLHLTTPAT